MKKILLSFALLTSLFATNRAMALSLVVDSNLFYFGDDFDFIDSKMQRYAVDFSLGIGLDQDSMFNIGINLGSVAAKDEVGTSKYEWSTTDYGIKFITYFDRTKDWGMGLAYNLAANGTFKSGGNEVDWRGTSLKVDIGYAPLIFHGVYYGIRLNYYLASYNEQSLDNGKTYQSESNTRSFLYPAFFISGRF